MLRISCEEGVRVIGVLVRKYGKGVKHVVARVIGGRRSTIVTTNISGFAKVPGSCPMFRRVARYSISMSMIVSFSGTKTISRLLSCYIGGDLPIILYAAKLSSRRLGGMSRYSRGVTILGSTGVSVKVGLLLGLLGSTTGMLTPTNCSVRLIRGRRGRGLSTPDKATLTLTSSVGRTVKGRCRCMCSEDRIEGGQSTGRVNVSTIHTKAVMKRRRIVFTKASRIVRFGRATCSEDMFTGNTIRTKGFLTKRPTNVCSVKSIVRF